jgi:two-component system chemotaxis response regulator CheB
MIKVFIIDDSLLVRNAIMKILKDETNIKVIGEAQNPIDAMQSFKEVGFPDVFILDIEMPKMDGLTFLKKINEQNPTAVIICSTLVNKGSSAAIDALRLGAIEIIHKPKIAIKDFFIEQKEEFIKAIKTASKAKVQYKPIVQQTKETLALNLIENEISTSFIAIGSSTGGVQVIEDILTNLKPNHKAIVITQHMPEGFTASFANRLNLICSSHVVEASEGEVLTNNKVIIAKGGIHTEVIKQDNTYKIKLKDFPKVNSHKPSVNVLFNSISKICNNNILAFILTGMGDDGATALKKLKDKGNDTYGQNEESCAVYGMPNIAKQIGATKQELSIQEIIEKINNY